MLKLLVMLTLSAYYQNIFNAKTYKLAIDAGCTCPNRDGTKAFGGCIFCSENGSGDFAQCRTLPVAEQIKKAKLLVEDKIKGRSRTRTGKYIAYFQNFTSTYGDSAFLIKKYHEALNAPDVVGLAIATRPDCLKDDILTELACLAETTFIQLELGLQTCSENSGNFINRCFSNEDYINAVKRIQNANSKIHIVTHLIFGLPNENEKDMLESVNFVLNVNSTSAATDSETPFGIKITCLYVLKNTKLAFLYTQGLYTPLTEEKYFSLLQKALLLLPENCVLHRLTGDPPKKLLLAPDWPKDKKHVLNKLNQLLSYIQVFHLS